jgi:histidinol dehydrogenase
MTVALAKEAGCPEIIVCTRPHRALNGMIDPNLLYALRKAGATEIYRVGGAHAIAAMAIGTKKIRRVQKIIGPGNAYVTAAKRLLFGQVNIDLLAGPSELLVLADGTADPRLIAADLVAQAEHGTGKERVWLVTTSKRVSEQTRKEIRSRLSSEQLNRRDLAKRSIRSFGVCVLVKDLDQAVSVTNQFAPEHLEIMTKDAATIVPRIKTAGAIFIGPWSPTVVGDYLAGPSHELPTGGAGAMFSGLTVDQFMRRTSTVSFSRSSLLKSLPSIEVLGKAEGLDAHVASAWVRFR